jgi:solute carrier family 26 (sodium-independent sulfate anion transporter), member 11
MSSPVEYGLMSSWLPAVLYTFMGTTKDLSTGPTSIIGLLTSEIVHDLSKEGYSPSNIASAVAFMIGVYCMALGFLKLGFLLDFISTSVLSGFISGIAVTIILGQIDNLLGEDGVGDGTATVIHDVFHQLPTCNGKAVAIGFGTIILLKGLEIVGQKWGKKNKGIFYFCTAKQFWALLLFTGISYAVNHKYDDSDDYQFEVSKVKADGIEHPKMPDATLIGKVAGRSIAAFLAAAIEHVAIARAFALRNNYVTDQSQELCYLGVTNFVNSFFHSMGVGGAMSRTAVNSACNVRSPLSGLVTTAVVLISIYEWTGALYWVPKATLAAIVITAVWPLISSPTVFYRYWKTSLFDFIASMLAFWVSLFVSTEIGIATAVGFCVVYCKFTSPSPLPTHPPSNTQPCLPFSSHFPLLPFHTTSSHLHTHPHPPISPSTHIPY